MIEIKEWALADAQRMQKPADDANKPVWNEYMKRVKHVAERGGDVPEEPDMPEGARVPEFHYSGERIFEVKANGASRSQVTDAIAQYVAAHRRPPQPMRDLQAETGWG